MANWKFVSLRDGSRYFMSHGMIGMRLVLALLCLAATAVACDGGDRGAGPGSAPNGKPSSRASTTPAEDEVVRTNLLLITLDTTRADALGVYGQAQVVTPHIDAFANEGVLFEDCVSSSPSTLPSHASIFTGRHPYAHGVRSNSGYVLRDSEVTLAEVLREHGYLTRAEIASEVMAPRTRFDQGFDWYHGVDASDVDLQEIRISDEVQERESVLMARSASDITRHGIRFLESSRAVAKPFFLWLHYFDPHRPYLPSERFKARFPDDPYLASVAYADNSIGDVLTALVRLELDDNTLVVITSDHGEGNGDHNEVTHSIFLYETTTRVPLIMRGPGVASGRRVAPLVRSVDIAPTLLDLLGLPPLEASQGVSLRSLMNGSESQPLTSYGESIELLRVFGLPVLRSVQQGRWKYIHTSPPELYDLESDPMELDNAAAREPERSAELRAALSELLQDETTPDDAVAEVEPETRARLEALGYLAGPAPPNDELASLELRAPPEGSSIAEDALQLSITKGAESYGYHEKAAEGFRKLRSRYPRSPLLLRLLVTSLFHIPDAKSISRSEISTLLDQAMELSADDAEVLLHLAQLSLRAGSADDAVATLRLALELEPCAGLTRGILQDLYSRSGRYTDQFEVARQGVLQCPDRPGVLNDMAWIFATSPVAELRDGEQALALAKRALSITPDSVGFRDTLAAAHAEAGHYPRAAAIIAKIIPELEQMQAPEQAIAIFQQHLAEFEAGRPLRE